MRFFLGSWWRGREDKAGVELGYKRDKRLRHWRRGLKCVLRWVDVPAVWGDNGFVEVDSWVVVTLTLSKTKNAVLLLHHLRTCMRMQSKAHHSSNIQASQQRQK